MSATRPRPPITGSGTGQGMSVDKFRRGHVSDEARERLSQLAKERHRNGGFQKKSGSRKKKTPKKRVAQMVAEAAREKKNAQSIIDVFKDGIHPGQPMTVRLKAAEAWLKIEHEDAKLQLREADSESQKRDRDELLTILSEKLSSGHSGLLIRKQLEQQAGITDAELVIEGHATDT